MRNFLPVVAATFLFARSVLGSDAESIANLSQALTELSPAVNPVEAEQVSEIAHQTARQLARDYRIIGSPRFQNFLIHLGVRERGYCFHWAYDIGAQLRPLRLRTLTLHWGAANVGTQREHNCLVVTARGQPFETGYVIDGWRHAGQLFWARVATDHYAWREDLAETRRLQPPIR